MSETLKHPKSPLILMSTISILIIATLVLATAYFLRPNIEADLRKQLHNQFSLQGLNKALINISGRDVTLKGFVQNTAQANDAENTAKHIWGIRDVNNQLLIKN